MQSPEQHFGFPMGADRKLVRWADMLAYFQAIAADSDRVNYDEIGRSTEDNPFVQLTISSPDNLANLERLREVQARLADPRGLSDEDAEQLVAEGRTIILITCSVHATEVGAVQMTPQLVWELATRDDPEVLRILDETILLLVPSLNPDGMEIVHDWYEKTLGTTHEGSQPPTIYNTYTGHDNNRDWFMFTQVETRLAIEGIQNVWHPHIVFDQHQMGSEGPRYVLPPFIDPYDRNVDPILRSQVALMGQAMAADLTAHGKAGVATNIIFDAFSPSRAYQHYHGGVRILSEAASVRIATPIHVAPERLREARGFDPRVAAWNHPLPWEGGAWTLGDIVAYNRIVTFAALNNAAAYPDRWVRNFLQISRNAVASDSPFAFIIPLEQSDDVTTAEMLEVLQTGGVEIHTATADFTADGVAYPAGSQLIFSNQPYSGFARTMLEVQDYPDLRLFPGGPPKPPYDITAHSLPLQMGVEVVRVETEFAVETELSDTVTPPQGGIAGSGNTWLLDPRLNASYRAVNQLLAAGAEVSRVPYPVAGYPAGAFYIEGIEADKARAIAEATHVMLDADVDFDEDELIDLIPQHQPRIGMYRSYRPNAMDEGWTRFILERYDVPFTTLRNQEIRQGGLIESYDVILLPHQSTADLLDGNPSHDYPAEFSGGLGELGMAQLRRFVQAGGTVIGLDGVCDALIKQLYLPVTNVLEDTRQDTFYNPGSMLRLLLDSDHPLAWGFDRETTALFMHSPAFAVQPAQEEAVVVGSYPYANQLLAGWMLGEERIAGKAALVETFVGDGSVILFGFRPQFRAQARGTYRLLFNALLLAGLEI